MARQVSGVFGGGNDVTKEDVIDDGWINVALGKSGLGGNNSELCGRHGLQGTSKCAEGSAFRGNDEDSGHDVLVNFSIVRIVLNEQVGSPDLIGNALQVVRCSKPCCPTV